MENQNRYKLIEGVFTAEEAGQVLYSLIQNKIRFHNVEILATHEKTGGDISHSEKRVMELLEVRNSLKEVLAFADDVQMKVKVDGYFEVSLVK